MPEVDYGDLRPHEAADLFPLLTGAPFNKLVQDIRDHGQQEPIVVEQGTSIILDGRNRYRACKEAGIEPRIIKLVPPHGAVAYIVSANLHRRHLTSAQRKQLALDLLPMYQAEARERQGRRTDLEDNCPESRERAPQATDQVGALVVLC
ncbi:MAG: ParB/RepB/Spo0J family partition protein [Streptosporangiaceae bacterium]